MNNWQKNKGNALGGRLRVNMKARAPVNTLKTQQKKMGINEFKEYMGIELGEVTPSFLGSVLDKYAREQEEPKIMNCTGWYTVNISNCQDLEDSSIMLALKYILIPLKVQLFDFKRSPNGAEGQFLVDNKLMANRLNRLNDKVFVLYTSRKIDVQVKTGLPDILKLRQPLTSSLLAKLRAALQIRYDASSGTLQLTRFHCAPELVGELFVLHSWPMLQQLLELIKEELPQMRILQLHDNYLCTLRAFDGVALPALELLDVGANRIEDVMELKHLRLLTLTTLDISDNPLAKQQASQLSDFLPTVTQFKGCKQQITVNPPLMRDDLGQSFCIKFAKTYYNTFNQVSRRHLLKAYYKMNALFSLRVSQSLQGTNNYRKLYDTNYVNQHSVDPRSGKLRAGLDLVMHTIGQMPELLTDVAKAHLHVQTFNNNLRTFSLCGNCKERSSRFSGVWETRYYLRQFTMQPANLGLAWLIINDMLIISPASIENEEAGDTQPNPQPSRQPYPLPNPQQMESDIFTQKLEDISLDLPKLKLITVPAPAVNQLTSGLQVRSMDMFMHEQKPSSVPASAVNQQEITPAVTKQEITPAVTKQEITPAVTKLEKIDDRMPEQKLFSVPTPSYVPPFIAPFQNIDEMPPLVKLVPPPSDSQTSSLEKEIDNTLLCEDDELQLFINEDMLLDFEA